MLEKILPQEGFKCVCVFWDPELPPAQKFFTDFDKARAYINKKDKAGDTVYIAQASYEDSGNRKHDNVLAVQSFWLDIDCGGDKPFATQKEGAEALQKFCKEIGLPLPFIVNSGNGLYAHWALTEPIKPAQWKQTARLLKELTIAHEFEVDQSRTADIASVLRPVGATHRKGAPKTVRLLNPTDPDPIDYVDFAEALAAAAKKKKISTTLTNKPKGLADINADAMVYTDDRTADANMIADKCNQIDTMRQRKGNIGEPLWHACIGLLRYTAQAPDIIHEWSSGHPDYTEADTNQKIANSEESGRGPITCKHFYETNNRGCLGCPHNGKITTPLILGRVVNALASAKGMSAPEPFVRADDGLYAPVDDINTKFYHNDLYVESVAFDESLGYEVITVKHHLPQEGWMECMIRTADLTDVRSAMRSLYDNHITVMGNREKKLMVAYLESYAEKLKRERKLDHLLCQMGWRDFDGEMKFVLGNRVFSKSNAPAHVSLAKGVPQFVKAFHTKGDSRKWVAATEIFSKPGMEPLAFAFLAGAFGAPLVKCSGYNGALISLLGSSGVGKTLIGMWALSAYGKPTDLIMHMDDTKNSLIGRLGIYNSLPLYIDEVTNLEAKPLSDLVYRVTQGRDRARMNADAVEKSVLNRWATLALVSTNASIIDKITSHKLDASAEINRVFEINLRPNAHMTREAGKDIYRTMTENYGGVGERYLEYLTERSGTHRAEMDKVIEMIDIKSGAQSDERFWSMVVGVTMYGAVIAKRLGLIAFDIKPVMDWAVNAIMEMRGEKVIHSTDAVSVLGQFLDNHAHNRIIVGEKDMEIEAPRGALYYRIEAHKKLLFISRKKFKEWIDAEYGSYTTTKVELMECGALRNTNKKKTLGAGTSYAGAQQVCLEIDLKCPALGLVSAVLVEEVDRLQKTGEKLAVVTGLT